MTTEDLEAEIEDMLLNAEPRIGGAVGIGGEQALRSMRITGLVGPSDCLTKKGATRALRLQQERWG